jgi:hypothetical protein
MKNEVNEKESVGWEALKVRLDALVLMLMKSTLADDKGKVRISEAAPLLYRVGYTPTEIANIFGKKKASEVSQYLYSKK